MPVCRQCWVSGRVQGVFFRAATRQRALELGVTGYARNLDDSRVEVLACGERDAVESLIASDSQAMGRVAEVICSPVEVDIPGYFNVD